jgi:hypothetical protein
METGIAAKGPPGVKRHGDGIGLRAGSCDKHAMLAPSRSAMLSGSALLVLVLGCGGATTTTSRDTTPLADPCPGLGNDRDEASAALTQCRERSAAWAHAALFDTALAEVRALAAAPRPLPPADAQRAADAVWALLDAVSPELTNHVALDRAENAAEAVLRDREGDPSRAAATEAEAVLLEIHGLLAPPADPCASEVTRHDEAVRAAARCP